MAAAAPPTSSTSLLSLPPPFCPPDCPPPALALLRHRWMLRNAPVLVQPSFDISHGNGLLCGFYHFSPDSSTVVVSLVYEGEASWEVRHPTAVNAFGSLLYRTHNYRTYGRTADIDHIAYHGCVLQQQVGQGGQVSGKQGEDSAGQPDWQLLHTTDFSGLQSWSRGSKARFLCLLLAHAALRAGAAQRGLAAVAGRVDGRAAAATAGAVAAG